MKGEKREIKQQEKLEKDWTGKDISGKASVKDGSKRLGDLTSQLLWHTHTPNNNLLSFF
jgi:hypothetical protein